MREPNMYEPNMYEPNMREPKGIKFMDKSYSKNHGELLLTKLDNELWLCYRNADNHWTILRKARYADLVDVIILEMRNDLLSTDTIRLEKLIAVLCPDLTIEVNND